MTQAQLERAVCRATGESRDVVRRVGFQFLVPPRPQPTRQFWRRYRRRPMPSGHR